MKWKTTRKYWVKGWCNLTYILIGSLCLLCWEENTRRQRRKQGDQFRNYWNNLGKQVKCLDHGGNSRGGSQTLNISLRESWQNLLIDWMQVEDEAGFWIQAIEKNGTAIYQNGETKARHLKGYHLRRWGGTSKYTVKKSPVRRKIRGVWCLKS